MASFNIVFDNIFDGIYRYLNNEKNYLTKPDTKFQGVRNAHRGLW